MDLAHVCQICNDVIKRVRKLVLNRKCCGMEMWVLTSTEAIA